MSTNGAGGLAGGRGLGSKMPLDWLEIGLISVEKTMLLSSRIPLES